MLRVLGPGRSLTGDLSRRDLLTAGGLGALGLSVDVLHQPRPTQAAEAGPSELSASFGKAKNCILLYIYGAWSQLDTFDPKPEAPPETRGEFSTIATKIPNLQICEHLPRTAEIIDRCTVVRSMTHPNPIHNAAYTLTGNPFTNNLEGRQRHPSHWPFFGGVLDYLDEHSTAKKNKPVVPASVGLPWVQSTRSGPNKRAGTFGGFLGSSYDPLWGEFDGESPDGDPFRSITPEGRFSFNQQEVPDITLDVLNRRHSLLQQLEQQSSWLEKTPAGSSYERNRRRAFDLSTTPQLRNALRIDQETPEMRQRYGMTLFGQASLCARRLIERGAKIATVVWDEFARSDESWDTHHDHHPRMKEFLLPGFDRAYSALLGDLEERGMLDETLVLCLSEHGRTPKFYEFKNSLGRAHWSQAYSQIFAGAGIARGKVVGASDETAAFVTENPLSPKDILCTAYHLLGIDPHTEIHDQQGHPWPLVGGGRVAEELLA